MRVEAYWAVAPGAGEIRAETLPRPGAGEVLVRTSYTGVSRGTEALVARGGVPPSQREAMQAPFQAGMFPFPVKYGYSAVGEVVAGEPALVGRPVFCLHPHQTAFVVPHAAVTPLPDDVPLARAILAANLETALNAVWDAGALPGERIHVIGGGVVGCLAAWLCGRLPGCEVTLCDLLPARERIAAALGVGFAAPDELARDADLVIHTSGSEAGLVTALRVAGPEARIVELSWYGDRPVTLPLGEAFHNRRLRLLSSQVGAVAPSMRPRWGHRRRLVKALELLRDPTLDTMIEGEASFADLPELMAGLAGGDALCWRIAYPAG